MVVHNLSEMNTGRMHNTRIWEPYTLKTVFAVGRYGRTGTHIHVIRMEVVVGETGEHRTGTFTVGSVFSTQPWCNSNRGQHGASPIFDSRWDLVDVTCKKCQFYLWADGPRPIGVIAREEFRALKEDK